MHSKAVGQVHVQGSPTLYPVHRAALLAESRGKAQWTSCTHITMLRKQQAEGVGPPAYGPLVCRTLQEAMRIVCSRSQVIWYDAVTTEGHLKWQNTLNALNRPFFEASDALFVNYAWKVSIAGTRLICLLICALTMFGNSHQAELAPQGR